MFDPLASPDAGQNCAFLVAPVFRNDDRDRLANRLFGREAEDKLCPLVPTCNDPVEVLLMIASSLDSTMDASERSRCSLPRSACSTCLTFVTSRLTSSTVSSPNNSIRLSRMTSRPSLQVWRSSPDQ